MIKSGASPSDAMDEPNPHPDSTEKEILKAKKMMGKKAPGKEDGKEKATKMEKRKRNENAEAGDITADEDDIWMSKGEKIAKGKGKVKASEDIEKDSIVEDNRDKEDNEDHMEGNFPGTAMPKGKKIAKGKGKAKANEDIEEDSSLDNDGDNEDNEDNEDYIEGKSPGTMTKSSSSGKTTAMHSKMEKTLADAQFSVNVIDLFNPPKELQLGSLNSRMLVATEAMNLMKAMTAQGIKPFTMENMIPIIIQRRYVDPGCIWEGINAYKAPTLKLSADGIAELEVLELAGGRHRLEAVTHIKKQKEKLLKAAHKKTIAAEKSLQNVSKPSAVNRQSEKVAGLLEVEEEIRREIAEISKWGIVLYDEGK